MNTPTSAQATLTADNRLTVAAALEEGHDTDLAAAWLECLADLCDDIITGQALYVTIGLNQKKTTLLATVNFSGGNKAYVAADSAENIVYEWVRTFGPAGAAARLADERT